jgi:transcriptional regulator with XRE-family HTH domain
MVNNYDEISALLKRLGHRLKGARLARNESQEIFAERLGITRQSYSRMERGLGKTQLINWLRASSILGRLGDWQELLAEKEDLFARYERSKNTRKRAGSKRKGKR